MDKIYNISQLRNNILNYMDAVDNLDRYPPGERNSLARLLTQATLWFAFRQKGKWFLGPAKYIGFLHQTPATYEAGRRDQLRGLGAEKACRYFSLPTPVAGTRIDTSHPAFVMLSRMARRLNDGSPAAKAVIYLVDPKASRHDLRKMPVGRPPGSPNRPAPARPPQVRSAPGSAGQVLDASVPGLTADEIAVVDSILKLVASARLSVAARAALTIRLKAL